MGKCRGARSAILLGLKYKNPPQEGGKCMHDNNRGGHKTGTIKCYWKTEEQFWDQDSTRNTETESGFVRERDGTLVWDLLYCGMVGPLHVLYVCVSAPSFS